MLHTVLLVCEIFIGLFGVFAVIVADNAHERLHGIFVIGLAIDGFLGYFSSSKMLSDILLIVLAIVAIVMIGMSIHTVADHLKRYSQHKQNKKLGLVDKDAKMPKNKNDFNLFDLGERIDARFSEIERRLDDREKELDERERLLNDREKMLVDKLQIEVDEIASTMMAEKK